MNDFPMDRRTRNIVIGLGLGSLTIGTDFTGVMLLTVALEQDLGADITTTQWVFNVYALSFGMGLVAGGRLADIYGRRRLLRIGLVLYLVASLLCALAPSIGWLLAARVVQGLGSAIVWPAILGIVSTSVEEDQRGFAIGLMFGAIGTGNAIGPILAGTLAGLGDWRLFFGGNVLLAAMTLAASILLVPADKDRRPDEHVDYLGMAVLSLAVFALLYALDVGADWGGLSLGIIALLAGAIALFAVFPFLEARVRDPLVPPAMLRNRHFMVAVALNALVIPAAFVPWIYFPQYLQKVLGWSITAASLSVVPSMVCIAIGGPIAGRLYGPVGPRVLLFAGYGMVGISLALFLLIAGDSNAGYMAFLPAIMLTGIGSVFGVSAAGTLAVAAVEPERASLASGVAFMVHLALGALGVAGATAVVFAVSTARFQSALERIGVTLSAADQAALAGFARGSPEARQILDRISPENAAQISTELERAFTAGFDGAMWLSMGFIVVGLVLTLFIGKPKTG